MFSFIRFSVENGGWDIDEHEMLVHLYDIYPHDLKKRRTHIYEHFHRYYPHYSRQDMVGKTSLFSSLRFCSPFSLNMKNGIMQKHIILNIND